MESSGYTGQSNLRTIGINSEWGTTHSLGTKDSKPLWSPDGTIPSGRGIKCMGIDGHECGSLDEKTIDDLLANLGIEHTKEPLYPHHPTLNPNQRKRADWKVGDTLVEYFGLTGTPAYDLRTQEKLEIVEENGIDFIGLYPEDLVNLDDSLVSKLT